MAKKKTDYHRCDMCGAFDYENTNVPFRKFTGKQVLCQNCIDFFQTMPPLRELMYILETWLDKLENRIKENQSRLLEMEAFKKNNAPIYDHRFSMMGWDDRIERINNYLNDRCRMHTWAAQCYKILKEQDMEKSANVSIKAMLKYFN